MGILTFMFIFIFEMLSVKALITCDDARDNLRNQVLINRKKVAFVIAYWFFFLSSTGMFFLAFLSRKNFKEVTDPYIIVMW